MHRYRLYVPPENITGDTAQLDGEEFHYCVNVLRRTGGTIAVFDGVSREWEAVIARVDKHHASLRLERLVQEATAPAVRIIACPALTKAKSFDAIVEAATELGAHVIAPVIADRCAAHARAAEPEARLRRWRRVAISAAKQCGRIALPEIRPPARLDELLPSLAPAAVLICTAAPDAAPLLRVLEQVAPAAAAMAVLVGPEADFTPAETAAAVEAGAHPVRLGPTTLRAGTATASTLSVVSAFLAAR